MNVTRTLIAIAIAAASTGCASYTYHAPIVGQDSEGNPMAGSFSVSTEAGSFWVQAPGGARCSGSYDPMTLVPTIVAHGVCTDGRTGEVVITRSGLSGTAIAKFSDGSTGQYVFGDMSLEQAFGNGGTAISAPARPGSSYTATVSY